MTYRLYWARRSGAAAVEFLLTQLGVDFELLDATPWSEPPGQAFEELKRVNPLGQLPTLITPGGEMLTESVAILWTLLERHPSRWVPSASDRRRAQCLRWMCFAASNLYAAVGIADYPMRWVAKPSAARALEAGAVARMRQGWAHVAAACGGTPFFLGDEPFIVDVYLAQMSRWWRMRDHLRQAQPALAELMQRVDRLPEVAPIWARHWDA
jgi:GST-like protein